MAYPVAPPPPWTPPKPPVRVWDVVVTVILLVLLAVLAMFTSFFGAFLAMASDPCGVVDCNTGAITVGVLLAMGAPWIILLAAVIVAIVLLVRRRLAFWVPLVASVLIVASWFVGAAIAASGVPT